jgi:hypothetical protein
MCTSKAQLDLRKEENIGKIILHISFILSHIFLTKNLDAFSMNGQQGRQSPTFGKIGNEENGLSTFLIMPFLQ